MGPDRGHHLPSRSTSPSPDWPLSNAYRPGLTGLLKTIATEVAGDGVTVNSVWPPDTRPPSDGGIAASTAGRAGKSRDQVASEWAASIPLGAWGVRRRSRRRWPSLASEAASYITVWRSRWMGDA